MTTPRLASAAACSSWRPPAPSDRIGAAAVPDIVRAARSRKHRAARAAAAALAAAALAAIGVTRRAALAASAPRLGHLHWIWIPVAIALEWASMAPSRACSAGRWQPGGPA